MIRAGSAVRAQPQSLIRSGVVCAVSRRAFGNAPARVRPGEEPPVFQWAQSHRETSAILVISSMFIVPMWMIVMWEDNEQKKKRATMAWAEAYGATDDPWGRRKGSDNNAA